MAASTFTIGGKTAAGGISVGVLENAAIGASLAGAGASTSALLLGPAVISAALAGAGTLDADVTFVIVLSNDQVSSAGTDITVTATSSGDLSNAVFGVEWGQGTYGPSKNIVGQVANQSITIRSLDGITPGTWNIRDYFNLDQSDPYTTRVYGAAMVVQIASAEATLSGVGTLGADVTVSAGGTAWAISTTLAGTGTLTVNFQSPAVVVGTGSGGGRAFRYIPVPERLPEIKRELEVVARKIKKTTISISVRRTNEDLPKLLELLNRLQEQYAQLRYAYEEATRAMLTRAEAEEESEFMDFISQL
jgi:hypothetical protein